MLGRLRTLLALLGPFALGAQAGSVRSETVDRIVAVVGDEIILASEVDEEILLAQLQKRLDPSDEEAVRQFRAEVLEALIESKVLYEKARAEGIHPERDEVDARVEEMLAGVKSQFPSEEAFLAQLAAEHATLDDLTKTYRTRIEQQLAVRTLVEKNIMSQIVVEEREIRDYWELHRAEVPLIPAGLVLRSMFFEFRGGDAIDSASNERAEIVRRRLQSGEDFATLAKVFSEGPTADQGGEIGRFLPDDLEPALADAVRELPVGEITPVLVTSRGAHILRVNARDDDGGIHLSQIVFLRDEEAARAAARSRAEAALARVRAGESFEAVARDVSEDPATRERGGLLGQIPVESLSPAHRAKLETLEVGGVSEVLEEENGLAIFLLEGREGEREPTYDDVRDRLEQLLRQEKGEKRYREYLAKAREEIFVENRAASES
jgi:peptidyl-prolyl cis-trans isomerase SurA